MTRSQVRYLLGTPMVADGFDKERWDYIYYLKKGRTRHVDSRRVTVYFDGDKVAQLGQADRRAEAAAAGRTSAAEVKNGRNLIDQRLPRRAARRADGARFRVLGERPVNLDSIAVVERLIRARRLAEDPDRRNRRNRSRRSPDPPRPLPEHRRRSPRAASAR